MLTEEILKTALSGNLDPLKSIPKTDLHLHSALSAPFSTYQKLSSGKIIAPPEKFSSLGSFLDFVQEQHLTSLANPDFFRATTEDMLSYLIEDGVTYCEPSFDIRLPISASLNWEHFGIRLQNYFAKVFPLLKISPDLGVLRTTEDHEWKESCFEALDLGIFEGIDIYGDESAKDLKSFKPLFEYARKKGCKIKIHSGEITAPDKILRDIEIAEPDVIQHGVRASENMDLVKEIASRKIQLNICVASNIKLSVTKDYQSHPIKKLFDHGVRVTINSDDYGVFNTSVSDDFLALYKHGIFSANELEKIRKNGFGTQASLPVGHPNNANINTME